MANDKSSQETVAAMATEIRHLREVIEKFKAILAKFPKEDAAPAYKKNPVQPWDRNRRK